MAAPKESFAKQVKLALAHMYDVSRLPRFDLTRLMTQGETLNWDERARFMRLRLLDAIEELNPGDAFSEHARERRSYALLTSRYVRSMTSQEVIEELSISERQYWREHQHAVGALIEVLWERYGQDAYPVPGPSDEAIASTLVREEVEHLVAHSEAGELDMREVAREAMASIQPAFAARTLRLEAALPETAMLVQASRVVIRQVCLNLLSFAADITADRRVQVELTLLHDKARLAFSTAFDESAPVADQPDALQLIVSQQLAESQQGEFHTDSRAGRWFAWVDLPKLQQLTVLIVDDNAAAIKLFQRYLNNSRYRTLSAQTGREAVAMAEQTHPAVITLDVMMPHQDGWEVLQTLRSIPSLIDTPIVVCSVLNEPALAASLGANDFLRKPVTRAVLLEMMDYWSAVRPPVR